MLRKRLLARMSRLHKTYTQGRMGASPWERSVELEFTINAASSLVPCLCPGWETSGPCISNAFSQAMIQTFSFISLGVADLPSHFNKPRGDSIIHWSSRTIGWHLTYWPRGLHTAMYSPQFPECPFEIRTSCTTLSRLPIAVGWDALPLSHSPPPQVWTPPAQYLQNSSHHERLEGLQAPDCSLPRV